MPKAFHTESRDKPIMTDHAFTDNPVLLDPNLTLTNSKREQKTITLTVALSVVSMTVIGSVMALLGVFTFANFPIVILGSLVGAVYLFVSGRRVQKLFQEEIAASEDAIRTVIHTKYGLDLVDPVVFNYSDKTISVSSGPLRALDSAHTIYVQLILHLSKDGRDLTASVLTPAVAR